MRSLQELFVETYSIEANEFNLVYQENQIQSAFRQIYFVYIQFVHTM
jgi:hypothetical protein